MRKRRPVNVVLASASPRRSELLKKIVLDFRVVPSEIDEEPFRGSDPADFALRAAVAKARAVGEKYPFSLIIAADTLVFLDGEIFGKPRTIDEAQAMIEKLSGRRHGVITAVALYEKGRDRLLTGCETSWITFKTLDGPAIDKYLKTVHPLDKAGSYAIQESGDLIVERVEGDYDNVVGLPVGLVRDLLARFNAR
jgi:septum formation protein